MTRLTKREKSLLYLLIAVAVGSAPAIAENVIAFRAGPGVQINCATSTPDHISTRGVYWCNSADSNEPYYTSPGGTVRHMPAIPTGATGVAVSPSPTAGQLLSYNVDGIWTPGAATYDSSAATLTFTGGGGIDAIINEDFSGGTPGGYLALNNTFAASSGKPIIWGPDILLGGRVWDGSASQRNRLQIAIGAFSSGSSTWGEQALFQLIHGSDISTMLQLNWDGSTNASLETPGSVQIDDSSAQVSDSNSVALRSSSGVLQASMNGAAYAPVFTSATTGTTVGSAGGASSLPATPLGYFTVQLAGGSSVKIPYYNP